MYLGWKILHSLCFAFLLPCYDFWYVQRLERWRIERFSMLEWYFIPIRGIELVAQFIYFQGFFNVMNLTYMKSNTLYVHRKIYIVVTPRTAQISLYICGMVFKRIRSCRFFIPCTCCEEFQWKILLLFVQLTDFENRSKRSSNDVIWIWSRLLTEALTTMVMSSGSI